MRFTADVPTEDDVLREAVRWWVERRLKAPDANPVRIGEELIGLVQGAALEAAAVDAARDTLASR